jgi:hypothetical protein
MLYMVKEVDEQVVAQYVNAYVSYLSKNAGQSLADAFAQSEDAVYFDELVSVETGIGSKTNDTVLSYVNDDDNTTTYINMNMNMNPNPNNSMFSVTVCGMDSDEAEAMAAVLAGMIEEYRATVNDKVGQHAATLVDTYAYVENDMVMQSYQESQLTLIASNRTSLDTKISDFSDAQQSYYDALITLTQLKSAEETEDVDAGEHGDAVDIAIRTPRISAKYVILGAIAGAFIACVWLVLVFIMSSTFHKIEEVQELYALPVLGQISNMSATKKWLSFVDRWLDSLRYREGMTQEEQMELAVSNISVSLKRDGVNRIFLTSSCHFTDVERSDINAIMDRIRKAGVEVSYGENIMRNVAAFETMASTGHVILVEKPGASRYEEIERELTLCMEQGAGVMGIVGMGC